MVDGRSVEEAAVDDERGEERRLRLARTTASSRGPCGRRRSRTRRRRPRPAHGRDPAGPDGPGQAGRGRLLRERGVSRGPGGRGRRARPCPVGASVPEHSSSARGTRRRGAGAAAVASGSFSVEAGSERCVSGFSGVDHACSTARSTTTTPVCAGETLGTATARRNAAATAASRPGVEGAACRLRQPVSGRTRTSPAGSTPFGSSEFAAAKAATLVWKRRAIDDRVSPRRTR